MALAFKKRFPVNFDVYQRACRAGQVVPGRVHIAVVSGGKYVVNFPTKDHWRQPSQLEYIRDDLVSLTAWVVEDDVCSIAIPALGCGLGGLDWAEVEPLIRQAFEPLPEVRVMLCPPQSSARPDCSLARPGPGDPLPPLWRQLPA